LALFAIAAPAIPAGAEDRPPQIVEKAQPDYPEKLRAAGITGVVVVQFGVDAKGKVENVSVFKSDHPELDAPAVEAVQKWKFQPATRDGRPVEVRVIRVPITFAMPPTAFRAFNNFGDALQLAATEQKVVFIDFRTTWCEPCKRMDQDTWRDPAVIALLRQKAISLEIDAEQAAPLASHFGVTAYPTLLVLRPDGTVIDRLVGYRNAATFTEEFNSILAGRTMLMVTQEAVAKAGTDPDKLAGARYNLAREWVQEGNDAEALAEFTWCFDIGMKQAPSYAGARLSFLVMDIADLGAHYPPALEFLKMRRDEVQPRIAVDSAAAVEFGSLNRYLGADDANLAAFEELPAGSASREALGPVVFERQLAAQHYAAAVTAMPYYLFKQRFEQVRTNDPKDGSIHAYLVNCAADELEALAGAGQLDDAREVLKSLLEFDHSDATISAAKERLNRAGRPDLMPNPPAAGIPQAAATSPAKI
jgi:TonB family protein